MATYKYQGSVAQYYTVKQSGNFDLKAYGAQGGSFSAPREGEYLHGGKGAEVGGQFYFNSGE